MQIFPLHPFRPQGDIPALRQQVRDLVAQHENRWSVLQRANCWFSFDAEFSKALGAAGLLGMTWPKQYGGHERTMLERYVVLEELLAAGAPAGLHWIADRQTGALLVRYGTEAQREKYLPGMARGEIYACIGLSEPNSGSDLASVRTSARRTQEGWRVNGQKVWTSGAHKSHAALTLLRTEEGSERQQGLSQLMIDLDTPGITIRPIIDMTGTHHFNEIFFDDVLLPLDALVGVEGQGWKQVTAELALERSGPERYLSSHILLVALIDAIGPEPTPEIAQQIGRLTAEMWTLRQMSMSTAAKLDAGEDPIVEAAIVKDLGNAYEQALPRLVQAAVDVDLAGSSALSQLLAYYLLAAPSFSLRGGTPEVLRGIIAKGLGLR
ncbi:acyl-CoA dehydrogenase family protein [Novosphingobium sp. KCTC 2891]|uniref:acyl-CoA dehydrogenase family protein n=1 Tax=Novosphingobium sp. KCTC 2891 TaxID=2989730 RepID=UPI0022216E04|nr:acyl-CoA dehydrogenase family protein [Novosphingobium sp. KCTC 2891]MCW1381209.1 acyl-CoA dehydrogenase family protein [Novosphingobium sp. KCTC 2891]